MNTKSNFTYVLQKKLREEKVISQVDLSKIMGISTVAITKWLNGGTPDMDKIPQLCELLKVTPNELFGYDTPEERVLSDTLYKEYINSPYKEAIDKLLNR